MEIQQNNKWVKIELPNGRVVDVLSPVLDEICKWIQDRMIVPSQKVADI